LKISGFGWQSAIKSAEVKRMSPRNKVVIFAFGAIAAFAGLGLAFTSLKHASIIVASAVWGS
jgi:ethanolamine transporter EutH